MHAFLPLIMMHMIVNDLSLYSFLYLQIVHMFFLSIDTDTGIPSELDTQVLLVQSVLDHSVLHHFLP